MASDVAGAFKILIEAQPDKAVDAFRDILNATNQASAATTSWAEKITGLNSAWELGEKVIGAAGAAISSLNEYASRGGGIAELEDKFKSFAANVGVDADAVTRSIQDMSEGTLSRFESMKLGSEAVFKGFSSGEISKMFGMAKVAADQGIGDLKSNFDGLSQAVLSGSSRALAGFGIFVEKGASVGEIFDAMEEKMKNVADAGPNIEETGEAIGKTFENIRDNVSEAIARSGPLNDLYLEISDTLRSFVDGLDFGVITDWVNVGVTGARELLRSWGISFGGILDWTRDTFNSSGEIAKSFFSTVLQSAYAAVDVIGGLWNGLVDTVMAVNHSNWIGKGMDSFVQSAGWAISAVGGLVEDFYGLVIDGWAGLFEEIGQVARDYPTISEKLGIDPAGFDQISSGLRSTKDTVHGFVEGINTKLEGVSGFSEKFFAGFDKGVESARYSSDSALKIYEDTVNKISSLKIGGKEERAKELKEIEEQSIASKKNLISEEAGLDKDAKARERELRRDHTNWIKDQFKEEKEAAQDAFSFALSSEEKAFRRNQEDALDQFKKMLESQKTFTDQNGTTTYFNDLKDLSDSQQKMFRDSIESQLKQFKRDQEDALDLMKEAQKQKKHGFDDQWEEVLKSRIGDKPGNLPEELSKSSSEKNRESIGKPEKVLKIEFARTGNEALDSLLQLIFDAAEARAYDEGVKTYAP